MNKFRPQEISKTYIIKQRLKYGRTDNYNWQTRSNWYPANMTKNQISIMRRWLQIHHYASHTERPAQYWIRANQMFMKAHFPANASNSYSNKYSCHAWL